jgi:hypothetical protein
VEFFANFAVFFTSISNDDLQLFIVFRKRNENLSASLSTGVEERVIGSYCGYRDDNVA